MTPEQEEFNDTMKVPRTAVEWGFKDVKRMCSLDFPRKVKVGECPVGLLYLTAALIWNLRCCAYSRSPKNLALQLLQKSSKSASAGSQRPIGNSFATVGVRDFWENGCTAAQPPHSSSAPRPPGKRTWGYTKKAATVSLPMTLVQKGKPVVEMRTVLARARRWTLLCSVVAATPMARERELPSNAVETAVLADVPRLDAELGDLSGLYSRSLKNPALQLLQKSAKSASTTPQRPIWHSFGTVGVRDF